MREESRQKVARERPLLGLRPDPRDRRPGRPDVRLPQDGREVRPAAGPEQDHAGRGDLPPGREERRPGLRDPAAGQADRGDGAGHRDLPGRARDASALGKSLGEILKKLFGHAVPDLYPKLEMGSRPLKGTRPRASSRPPTSRRCRRSSTTASTGSGWSSRTGPKFVPDPAAPVAKEVLDYLEGEHSYGNKDTRMGKALEKRFGGIGYGWDRGHAAAGPGRPVPGKRDRGHLPGQQVPQLPRPGLTDAVHEPARIPLVAVLTPPVRGAQDADSGRPAA